MSNLLATRERDGGFARRFWDRESASEWRAGGPVEPGLELLEGRRFFFRLSLFGGGGLSGLAGDHRRRRIGGEGGVN